MKEKFVVSKAFNFCIYPSLLSLPVKGPLGEREKRKKCLATLGGLEFSFFVNLHYIGKIIFKENMHFLLAIQHSFLSTARLAKESAEACTDNPYRREEGLNEPQRNYNFLLRSKYYFEELINSNSEKNILT